MSDDSNAAYYPPAAFHFSVKVGADIVSFQKVSGIGASLEFQKEPEGGSEGRNLPERSTYTNLVLERGIAGSNSEFMKWCIGWFTNWRAGVKKAQPMKDIQVSLLNEQHVPLHTWHFLQAYPVKWSMGAFDAQKNEVAIETIELTYESWEWQA
ncbi:MAG: phage tail protein [Burkholderiales bacterium]